MIVLWRRMQVISSAPVANQQYIPKEIPCKRTFGAGEPIQSILKPEPHSLIKSINRSPTPVSVRHNDRSSANDRTTTETRNLVKVPSER